MYMYGFEFEASRTLKKAIINFICSYIQIFLLIYYLFVDVSFAGSFAGVLPKITRLRKISRKAPQKVSSNLKQESYANPRCSQGLA